MTRRALLLIVALVVALAQRGDAQSTTTFAWDPSPDVVDGYVGFVTQDPTVPGSPIALGLVFTHQVTRMDPSSTWYFAVASTLNGSRGPSTPFLRVEGTTSEPPPPSVSPDGATTPPDAWLTDSTGGQWRIDTERRILLNGVQAANGSGDLILWYGGRIYVKNNTYPDANGSWWRWEGTGWSSIPGDPRGSTPPPSEPPPPSSDTTKPIVSLTAVKGKVKGKSKNVEWAITASATDNVAVTSLVLYSNGSSFYTCPVSSFSSCKVTVTLGSGSYTLSAIATDAAGNQGSKSQTVSN